MNLLDIRWNSTPVIYKHIYVENVEPITEEGFRWIWINLSLDTLLEIIFITYQVMIKNNLSFIMRFSNFTLYSSRKWIWSVHEFYFHSNSLRFRVFIIYFPYGVFFHPLPKYKNLKFNFKSQNFDEIENLRSYGLKNSATFFGKISKIYVCEIFFFRPKSWSFSMATKKNLEKYLIEKYFFDEGSDKFSNLDSLETNQKFLWKLLI